MESQGAKYAERTGHEMHPALLIQWLVFWYKYWCTRTVKSGEGPYCWKLVPSTLEILEWHSTEKAFCWPLLSYSYYWKRKAQLPLVLIRPTKPYQRVGCLAHVKPPLHLMNPIPDIFACWPIQKRIMYTCPKITIAYRSCEFFLTLCNNISQIESYSICSNHCFLHALLAGMSESSTFVAKNFISQYDAVQLE